MSWKKLGIAATAIGGAMALLGNGTAQGHELVVESLPDYEPYAVEWSSTPDQQWTSGLTVIPVQGDFDGDGSADFYLYGPGSAPDQLWLSKAYDGGDQEDRFALSSLGVSGLYRPFVGDFDGNGSDDIFWYAPGSAPDSIWYFSGGVVTHSVAKTVGGTYQPIVADFDQNDGVPSDDIFWYGEANAESVWSGRSNRSFVTRTYPLNVGRGAKVLLGNFTADSAQQAGVANEDFYFPDLFFYVPGTGADSLWSSDGAGGFTASTKTVNGDYTPIVGNFDQGTPGWAGGLTDILWYTAGKASDTVWINNGGGGFTSKTIAINGTYKPFVIPGVVGPDTIMWNNPSGGDSVWSPKGAEGTWAYASRSWPAADMGARTPYVGYMDDALEDLLVELGIHDGDPVLSGAGGATGSIEVTTTTTTQPEEPVYRYEALPRPDVFWFSAGSASGQDERFWHSTGTQVLWEYPPGTEF